MKQYLPQLKIQQRVENDGMLFEATWNANGAVAVNKTRFSESLPQIKLLLFTN